MGESFYKISINKAVVFLKQPKIARKSQKQQEIAKNSLKKQSFIIQERNKPMEMEDGKTKEKVKY